MIGIYKITNTKNGKCYVGQSIDIKRRFWDHRCISHETNRHLRHAMQKYGKDAFSYEVLEECDPAKLDEREQFWIEKIKPEYNVMSGGQGRGKRHSDDTRSKLIKAGKESWEKKSEKEKASVIKNNLKGPKRGHAVSEKTRKILRDKNTGKKQSIETIQKRVATRAKNKQKGYVVDHYWGRKTVVCIETGVTFDSLKQAAEWLGVHPSNISAVLKGRQKTSKGLHFKYSEV